MMASKWSKAATTGSIEQLLIYALICAGQSMGDVPGQYRAACCPCVSPISSGALRVAVDPTSLLTQEPSRFHCGPSQSFHYGIICNPVASPLVAELVRYSSDGAIPGNASSGDR
ncbi:hypothetical protein MPSEU_000629100 [Mayamaea pseudoterrestris]|nr:hypothetical protein MPSEU_000629100 [Mayamaea pseudoterrestris]